MISGTFILEVDPMPIGLYALAIAAFAIGMTEFVVVGILPSMASSLNVSISQAGAVVSVYALCVAVAAPILTVLTGKFDRRRLAIGLMALFVLANALGWLATTFETLLVSRALAGVVHGVFYSMATVVAASLVPKEKSGQAIAIMFSGVTVALVTGVPLGTFLGELFGWRSTFLFVTASGVLAMLAMLFYLPKNIERPSPATISRQFSVVFIPRLLLVFLITAVGYGGAFVAFTYLSEIMQAVTGFSPNQVGVILIFYGLAVMYGNMYFAKLADQRGPVPALLWVYGALTAVLAVLSFVAASKLIMVPLVMLWGAVAFGSVPVLQLYAVQQANKLAPHAVDAASSMNIASFNGGIALGAWGGGLVVANTGLLSTGPIAAAVVGVGFLLAVWSGYLDRRIAARDLEAATEAI